MYDRETDSLWSQILGEGVRGQYSGTKLEQAPHDQMTWERWLELHSNTLVLDKGGGTRADPYLSYYADNRPGIIGESLKDNRLRTKEFVLGVTLKGKAKAYPFRALSETNVVNDVFAGTELLIVFDPEAAAAKMYHRKADGRTLTFSKVEEASGRPILQDKETGSLWDGLVGAATGGPLKGGSLTPFPATTAFWFGWKDYHPATEVYGLSEK